MEQAQQRISNRESDVELEQAVASLRRAQVRVPWRGDVATRLTARWPAQPGIGS